VEGFCMGFEYSSYAKPSFLKFKPSIFLEPSFTFMEKVKLERISKSNNLKKGVEIKTVVDAPTLARQNIRQCTGTTAYWDCIMGNY
jgi:hypothetical protein